MKKKYFILVVCFLTSINLLAQSSFNKIVKSPPNPPRLVNDYANLLSEQEEFILEQKLVAYDDSTSTQIAVVTVNDLNKEDVVDAANELLINWGVGNKKTNNGFVVLVSLNPRKAGIAVGYGLEGVVTDYTADDIYRNDLVPGLKTGNYFGAFDKTTTSLIDAAAGKFIAPDGYRDRGQEAPMPFLMLMLIMFLIFFLIIYLSRKSRTNYMSRRGYREDYTPPFIFWNGGGNSGWGDGDSGGGFGGFGGFGGGSSGGGGAGGGW